MVAKKSEKAIMNDILLDASKWPKTMVWRNNTGMAWQGERVRSSVGSVVIIEPGMVVLRKARAVKFGLEGSGDILGATDGVPLAIEVKAEGGRQREAQKNFEEAWVKAGGLYVVARSVEEARSKVSGYAKAEITIDFDFSSLLN